MGLRGTFKALTVKLFGGYDSFRVVYVMFIVGIAWPLKRHHFGPSVWNSFVFYGWRSLVTVMNLGIGFDMASDGILVMNDLPKLTYSLTTSTLYFGTVFHYLTLALNKREIEDCLDLLNNNFYLPGIGDTKTDVAILKKGERRLNFFIKTYGFFAVLGVVARILYHLKPPVQTLLPFPFPEYLVPPFFGIMFFFQLFGLFQYLITLVSSQMIVLGFLIKVVDHFDILNKNISKMATVYASNRNDVADAVLMSGSNPPRKIRRRLVTNAEDRRETVRDMMKEVIIHHQNILRVIQRMNRVLAETLFLQVVGVGFFVALLCTDLIWKSEGGSLKALAQCTYAGAFFINASVICFYGSRIEIKSHQAANTLYMGSWLKMDVENRKNCLFFLKALWRQPVVKASGALPVNLKTFVNFVYLIYDSITFMIQTVDRISH